MDERTPNPPVWRAAFAAGLACGALTLCGCEGEYIEQEVEIGYRGEAARNPFLAAQRMCEEYGVSSETRPSLDNLPPRYTTLTLSSEGVTTRASAALIGNWVAEGGSLIYFLGSARRSHHDLAEEFLEANSPAGSSDRVSGDFLLEYFKVHASSPGEDPGPTWFQGKAYDVEFSSNVILEFDSANPHPDSSGSGGAILDFSHWAGEVILVADDFPFHNRQIGNREHAALFWAMISRTRKDDLLIVAGAELSFLTLLWSRGWMVLVPILLAIVIWLWKNLPRQGPLLPDEVPSKRDFAKHIDATGEFLWRQRALPQLLAPLRRRIFHRLRSIMGWEDPAHSEPQHWEALADRAGLPVQRIRDALLGDPGREPSRFVQLCRDLNTLEERL
ncbi:MAG: hypothetical protein CMP28_04120 [Roseibacillus sp.]|nr:hypothetical protein [Roseibacillus sp.]